jgi:cyclic beta-1,2-glucan synthetase
MRAQKIIDALSYVETPVTEGDDSSSKDNWIEQLAIEAAAEYSIANGRRAARKRLYELKRKGLQLESFLLDDLAELFEARRFEHLENASLIDVYPIIMDRLRDAVNDLARCRLGGLPRIQGGEYEGFPRIYAIALLLTTRIDDVLRPEWLRRFLLAYAGASQLTSIELGKFDLLLRIALWEKLQTLSTNRSLAAPQGSLETSSIQNNGSDDRLDDEPQASSNRAIENTLISICLISNLNWADFTEKLCPIDQILKTDPAAVYESMEYGSRIRYRLACERIAARSDRSEIEVAGMAVELALASRFASPDDDYLAHVGYYLIDEGVRELERKAGYHPTIQELVEREARRNPLRYCFWGLLLLTAFILTAYTLFAALAGADAVALLLTSLLFIIPASELALRTIETLIYFEAPWFPILEYGRGVSSSKRTIIVIPCILSSESAIRGLIEALEAHYLSNQDDHIYFGLLGDWSDSIQEQAPEDNLLLECASRGIEGLNRRYVENNVDRFYLFHRRRQWNPCEGKWIGWERKRGKLREFNRLLRGKTDTSYVVCTADQRFLEQIQFVITLDSDTVIPQDSARRMIGLISHPLNQPRIEAITGKVKRGYIIIQPNSNTLPRAGSRSRLPRLISNYKYHKSDTLGGHDVYQNLFDEGIYIGKALYDVDAFERALAAVTPENSLLSHDLFESLYARTAAVSDIELLENRRIRYKSQAKRMHRWGRGDWQLLPWLTPTVRDAAGNKISNPLSGLSRWKIFDNLRRSLFPIAMYISLLAGWLMLPGSPTHWTMLFVLAVSAFVCLPIIKSSYSTLPRRIPNTSMYANIKYIGNYSFGQAITIGAEAIFLVTILPHQVYLRADAIIRTLYRLSISRKHLLEWVTSDETQRNDDQSVWGYIKYMWPSPVSVVMAGGAIYLLNPPAMPSAAPFLLIWMLSPLAAYSYHQREEGNNDHNHRVERALRLNARSIWRDLESVGRQGDDPHINEIIRADRAPQVAPVASTTNLFRRPPWIIAEYQLGGLGIIELVENMELTISHIAGRLSKGDAAGEKGNGFLNHTLRSRRGAGIENGSLTAHLCSLRHLSAEIYERRIFDRRILIGLADTLTLLKAEFLRRRSSFPLTDRLSISRISEELTSCARLLAAQDKEPPKTFTEWRKLLNLLTQHAAIIDAGTGVLNTEFNLGYGELRYWVDRFSRQIREFSRDLAMLAPWASEIPSQSEFLQEHGDATTSEWTRLAQSLDQVSLLTFDRDHLAPVIRELFTLRSTINHCKMSSAVNRSAQLHKVEQLLSSLESASDYSSALKSRFERALEQLAGVRRNIQINQFYDDERLSLKTSRQGASVTI